MSKLRDTVVWAILYNHSWDPGGYAFMGFYFALLFITGLVSFIINGTYLGIVIFSLLLVSEFYIGRFIWKVIRDSHKD